MINKISKACNFVVKKYIYHPIKNFIAKLYCFVLQKMFGLTVVGITGSAGKTTTKEMLAGILRLKAKTVWSKDNIDPVYNIASTILRCTPFTKYLILELGVEYQKEMDFYLSLVRPKIGIITNIFPTHTLYFGDENGVFNEKSKLVKNIEIAVLNEDDKYLKKLKFTLRAKEYWFKNADNPIDTCKNIARCAAETLGINNEIIEAGLIEYQNPKHRLEIISHKSGAVLLDDTYNSNPEALISTIKYFNKLAGKNTKIAVIGDMLELGKLEISEHKRVASEIKKYNFSKIYGVGSLVKYITDDVYKKPLDVYPDIKRYLKPNTYILFKASRSISLDKLVDKMIY